MSQNDDLAHLIGSNVSIIKGDAKEDTIVKAAGELIQSNAITFENDVFGQFMYEDKKAGLIRPTYNPLQLSWLCHQNNTLAQCIAAMEVNIDGTGFEIERKDGTDLVAEQRKAKEDEKQLEQDQVKFDQKEAQMTGAAEALKSNKQFIPDSTAGERPEPPEELPEGEEAEEGEEFVDPEVERITGFFDEPWPSMSFTTIRRKLRIDLECQGNAYLEVIRDKAGEIIFLNYMDAKIVRMVKLDTPVAVVRTVVRGGEEIECTIVEAQRRYAQMVSNKLVYFKEFGADRKLDKTTGTWEPSEGDLATPGGNDGDVAFESAESKAGPIDEENEATEVIHFMVTKDVATPYGVPRWINQVPSVLGSRKAEELNLEFFDSGGIPPVMILIQGGQMAENARKELTSYLAGKAKFKNRGVIAEMFSTSGSLDGTGNVKVSIERFGAERQQDSMFENYDERSSERVRMGFRLPPIFVGKTSDYTRATAYVSYMVGEAQVFAPERDEFDEIMNVTLMKEFNREYVFRSKAIGINDVEQQLKAFDIVKDDLQNDQRIEVVNEIAHMNMPIPEPTEDEDPMDAMMAAQMNQAMQPVVEEEDKSMPEKKPIGVAAGGVIAKMEDDILLELANDWVALLAGDHEFESESMVTMKTLINVLGPAPRKLFDAYVGKCLAPGGHDPEGVGHLMDCVSHVHDK